MCAAPTSAADAWTDADADWERLQTAAAEAFAADDPAGAAASWGAALRIAREHFEADDPRLATSLANHASALRRRGEPVPARLWQEALEIWDQGPAWLARQRFGRRARSSMFHLRLEARHPGAYDANLRRRAETLLCAARAATATLAAGAHGQAPERAALRTFQSARPDALRKVLAATHLLLAPTAREDARLRTARNRGS
jgi:hypothetical protein